MCIKKSIGISIEPYGIQEESWLLKKRFNVTFHVTHVLSFNDRSGMEGRNSFPHSNLNLPILA